MPSTRSRRHHRVCTDPFHVVEGAEGTVVIFFPDGQSVALTVEAAAGSTLLLARAVRRANEREGGAAKRGSGAVIPADFIARPRLH